MQLVRDEQQIQVKAISISLITLQGHLNIVFIVKV